MRPGTVLGPAQTASGAVFSVAAARPVSPSLLFPRGPSQPGLSSILCYSVEQGLLGIIHDWSQGPQLHLQACFPGPPIRGPDRLPCLSDRFLSSLGLSYKFAVPWPWLSLPPVPIPVGTTGARMVPGCLCAVLLHGSSSCCHPLGEIQMFTVSGRSVSTSCKLSDLAPLLQSVSLPPAGFCSSVSGTQRQEGTGRLCTAALPPAVCR